MTGDLELILNSGASHHITSNYHALTSVARLPQAINIKLPHGHNVVIQEVGTVDLGNGLILRNVLCSPILACNLISVQKLTTSKNGIMIYRT